MLKLFEKIMYPILIIFLSLAVYYSRTNLVYFESTMVAEDGFFQWMIFYTLLFASVMCFYRASILKPFRGAGFSACLVFAGIVFLAFAMDEMSWGQRVFHFNSPGFFLTHNTKMQLNFHHLVLNGFHFNNIIFTLSIKVLATLYFLVLPFFYTKLDKIKGVVNRFAVALPRYTQTGAYLILAGLVSFIPSDLRYVIFEFGFYWILVLMMYNPLNDEIFSRKSINR
ncbi:MAG: hypothetical protein Q7U04_12000 [Bacteriovorax sp.]|nr:hypothetical protein [Bacteriovorax sp.]